MKNPKQMASREFQHNFGKLAERLKGGESITVTKRGRTIGTFTKASEAIALNFLAGLDERPYLSPEALEKLIREARGLS
jgi:hypothetical protein